MEDNKYLEIGLPKELKNSIQEITESWERIDNGISDLHWDIAWDSLNSDINVAEVEQLISAKQANYLRKKYLRMDIL